MKLRSLLSLSVSVSALAPVAAFAQSTDLPRNEIIVTALPLQTTADEADTPVIVLTGDDLHHRARATIGETLAGEPGVSLDNFGGGASRPVIRGQTSPRVEVLSAGSAIQDASEISPDHAVVAEPLLLRGIEVLRGPATLRYGGGAIGGAVNLLDEKVPTEVPENGLTGVLEGRLGTADNERSLVGGATIGTGNFALRVEGVDRSTDDYDVPSEFGEDKVHGSFNDTRTYTFGGSYVDANGYFGAAYTNHKSTYGLPGHSHEYESCHPHGTSLHCGSHDHNHDHDHGHDHDHNHDHEHMPFINLRSERVDVRGEYRDLVSGIENVSFRYAYTDYEHAELEEEGEVSTTFSNEAHDVRFELTHAPIGPLRGLVGMQYSQSDFASVGMEQFLPPSRTRNTALFLMESAQVGPVRLELAARHEWQTVRTTEDREAKHRPFSVSGAAVWDVDGDYSLALALARSERAPNVQELYSNTLRPYRGVHLATNTWEIGTPTLDEEVSKSVNLTLRKSQGPTTFTVGVYHQDFDNYIYAETLDRYEDFRLIRYSGVEATFTGIDGEIRHQFAPGLSASIFGDYVRGKLKDDLGNLPRIPPGRLGGTVEAEVGRVSFDAQYYHAFNQEEIASYETITPRYNMLNATLAYKMDIGEGRNVELFARGTNLFNELAFNHASFIKDVSPLRGRNVVFGLRTAF